MKKTLRSTAFVSLLILMGLVKPLLAISQVETGKSYTNISKGATGGTFEPGDTLEIRSAIAVSSKGTVNSIDDVRYNDSISNDFIYLPNSLKIITNEGLTFRAYTDAANDDNGMYNAAANNLRINLGNTATNAIGTTTTAATGGTIIYSDKPSFYGGVCIMVASFKVRINPALAFGTIITLPGGAFRYTQSTIKKTAAFTAYKIAVFKNLGSCNNFIGSNAIIENNGSFNSGTTQNRSNSGIVPGYTFINFSSGQPNDGFYGIANNTSATGATNSSVAIPNSSRVFSVWDIIGDHTGASNLAAGNAPAAVGTNGGYMAVVNASYATSPAIQQNVTGLCTNTYYDFNAWFRNICSKCSCDSNGRGSSNPSSGFNGPYPPGVKPNLTYQLDGVDYYTTGDLPYTGLWAKKGFTYFTGLTQTAFTLTIRNNSPGGGGNDWAIDDVSLSTCEPNVDLNITPVLLGCAGTQVDFKVTVNCYFPNYTFFKWQKSIDGGTTWIDTGVAGTGSPTLINGQWNYVAAYPSFIAQLADSGSRYRVVTATGADNLASSSCSYSNNKSTLLNIMNCAKLLQVQLTDFNGQLINKKSSLQWASSSEKNISHYEIEKSTDGKSYYKIGAVKGRNSNSTSMYRLVDEEEIIAAAYYRLKMIDMDGLFKYSEIILLSNKKAAFAVAEVSNPFHNSINIAYTLPNAGKVNFSIADMYGKAVYRQIIDGKKSLNNSKLDGLDALAPGMYAITIFYENLAITKRIIKL